MRIRKIIAGLVCFLLIFEQSGFAQVASQIDLSGSLFTLRNHLTVDKFRPTHLRFLSYDPKENNFRLLLDKGDSKEKNKQALNESTRKLLQHFFVGIALPNDSFWVNLRPDAQDNVIDPALAQTDVGKILLEADLQLKKDTASATSPQTQEGREYWDKLYKKAQELYGSSNVSIPTLTRPWIVPGEIIIQENNDNAYIYKATLKVCLEQDYLKNSTTYKFADPRAKALNEYSSMLIKEKIIPKLTKEINTAKRYADLRQVYYSLILAQWFKARFRGKAGEYSLLIDRQNLDGLTSQQAWSKTTYFKAYQQSFQKGEYNIQEPSYGAFGNTIRTYFSGGMSLEIIIPPVGASSPANADTRISSIVGTSIPQASYLMGFNFEARANSEGSLTIEEKIFSDTFPVRESVEKKTENNTENNTGKAVILETKEVSSPVIVQELILGYLETLRKTAEESSSRILRLREQKVSNVVLSQAQEYFDKSQERFQQAQGKIHQLRSMMKDDSVLEFARVLRAMGGRAATVQQRFAMRLIREEVEKPEYAHLQFDQKEVVFVYPSSWLADFFAFDNNTILGQILTFRENGGYRNIILINGSMNQVVRLISVLLHEIVHKAFENGGNFVEEHSPSESSIFHVLEEATTENLTSVMMEEIMAQRHLDDNMLMFATETVDTFQLALMRLFAPEDAENMARSMGRQTASAYPQERALLSSMLHILAQANVENPTVFIEREVLIKGDIAKLKAYFPKTWDIMRDIITQASREGRTKLYPVLFTMLAQALQKEGDDGNLVLWAKELFTIANGTMINPMDMVSQEDSSSENEDEYKKILDQFFTAQSRALLEVFSQIGEGLLDSKSDVSSVTRLLHERIVEILQQQGVSAHIDDLFSVDEDDDEFDELMDASSPVQATQGMPEEMRGYGAKLDAIRNKIRMLRENPIYVQRKTLKQKQNELYSRMLQMEAELETQNEQMKELQKYARVAKEAKPWLAWFGGIFLSKFTRNIDALGSSIRELNNARDAVEREYNEISSELGASQSFWDDTQVLRNEVYEIVTVDLANALRKDETIAQSIKDFVANWVTAIADECLREGALSQQQRTEYIAIVKGLLALDVEQIAGGEIIVNTEGEKELTPAGQQIVQEHRNKQMRRLASLSYNTGNRLPFYIPSVQIISQNEWSEIAKWFVQEEVRLLVREMDTVLGEVSLPMSYAYDRLQDYLYSSISFENEDFIAFVACIHNKNIQDLFGDRNSLLKRLATNLKESLLLDIRNGARQESTSRALNLFLLCSLVPAMRAQFAELLILEAWREPGESGERPLLLSASMTSSESAPLYQFIRSLSAGDIRKISRGRFGTQLGAIIEAIKSNPSHFSSWQIIDPRAQAQYDRFREIFRTRYGIVNGVDYTDNILEHYIRDRLDSGAQVRGGVLLTQAVEEICVEIGETKDFVRNIKSSHYFIHNPARRKIDENLMKIAVGLLNEEKMDVFALDIIGRISPDAELSAGFYEWAKAQKEFSDNVLSFFSNRLDHNDASLATFLIEQFGKVYAETKNKIRFLAPRLLVICAEQGLNSSRNAELIAEVIEKSPDETKKAMDFISWLSTQQTVSVADTEVLNECFDLANDPQIEMVKDFIKKMNAYGYVFVPAQAQALLRVIDQSDEFEQEIKQIRTHFPNFQYNFVSLIRQSQYAFVTRPSAVLLSKMGSVEVVILSLMRSLHSQEGLSAQQSYLIELLLKNSDGGQTTISPAQKENFVNAMHEFIVQLQNRNIGVELREIILQFCIAAGFDQIGVFMRFMQEDNETVIGEKLQLLNTLGVAGFSVKIIMAIVGAVQTQTHDNQLRFLRGINAVLKSAAMTAEDSSQDWECFFGDYIPKFGFLADRNMILVHRFMYAGVSLDDQRLAEFRLRDIGVTQTGIAGVRELVALIPPMVNRIFIERDIDENLLESPLVEAFVAGLTGFSTAQWGHGSSRNQRLKDFVARFHVGKSQGLVAPLDQAFTQESSFSVNKKGLISFSQDARTKFDEYSAVIQDAVGLGERAPNDQFEELRHNALNTLDEAISVASAGLQDVAQERERQGRKAQLEQMIRTHEEIKTISPQASLLDLAMLMVKHAQLRSLVRLALLTETLKNPEHQAFKKSLVGVLRDGAFGMNSSLPMILELKRTLIKDHTLAQVDSNRKKALLNCVDLRVFEEELSRVSILQGQSVRVNAFATRGVLGEMAGDIGDACYTANYDIMQRTSPSKITPILFTTGEGAETRFSGSLLILENSVQGVPVMILRAINPSPVFMQDYSARDFLQGAIRYVEAIAKDKGVKTLLVSLGSPGALSNRTDVLREIVHFVQGESRFDLDIQESFNGYDITRNMLVAVSSSPIEQDSSSQKEARLLLENSKLKLPQELIDEIVQFGKYWPREIIERIASGNVGPEVMGALEVTKGIELTDEEESILWKVFQKQNPYLSDRSGYPQEVNAIIEAQLGMNNRISILDIGCGPNGAAISEVKKKYDDTVDAWGMDLNVNLSARHPGVSI